MEQLGDRLQHLLNVLELDRDSELYRDAISLLNYLEKTNFQIAVFAPFNHGKSTLLNALLGQKSLPIDLIPSTGTAIEIRYGEQLQTKIVFADGTEQVTEETKILKEYAILDSDRQMRQDIQAVEIKCNYPLLKNNVELLDLPGTNDREAQDQLVKNKLLTADLIVHVLDGRKMMTLLEREKLRDWLQARGIQTVIFVVNFLNLLEPSDQKKVYNRLKFVAESFRSELPPGVSNIYRVDALPALRGRIKGDYNAVMEAGLTNLETALQTIVKAQQQQPEIKLARLKTISSQLIELAREEQTKLEQKIAQANQKQEQTIAIKQKAITLIKQGLQRSISEFESWLYLPNLLKAEQANLAIALQEQNFTRWKQTFNQTISTYQQNIIHWLAKAQEFIAIAEQPKLIIDFPSPPKLETPKQQQATQQTRQQTEPTSVTQEIDRMIDRTSQTIKKIIAGEGKAVLTNLTAQVLAELNGEPIASKSAKPPSPPTKSRSQLYAETAEAYLTIFSDRAFATLREYQQQVEQIINAPLPQEKSQANPEGDRLALINSAIDGLLTAQDNID